MTTTNTIQRGHRLVDVLQSSSNIFSLKYDGEYADVVILYPSKEDVLLFNVHSITTNKGNKTVACREQDCPYCKQSPFKLRLFVPIYNIAEDAVQFWPRMKPIRFIRGSGVNDIYDAFKRFPDLTDYVFRITRHGDFGYVGATYDVRPIAINRLLSYQEILDKFNITFPEHYGSVIEELDFTPEPKQITSESAYTALICKGCGAPIDTTKKCCNFCGTSYIW